MSIIAMMQEEVFINEIGKIIYNPEDLLVYASGLWTGLATATVSLIGMVSGSSARNRAAYRARLERDRLKGELKILEDGRQTIKNPYAGVTDISGMAKDLSSLVSNPFASLGVATQAAEIQIEEADIALANTLDTLRATGASAGGATALAQAALQSKKGVSANIEKQEAENEKLKAKGSGGSGGGGGGVWTPDQTGGFSDRRLKKNIKLIGYSPSRLKIYTFEYINKVFGKGFWQGVMSDEIPQVAVIKHKDGYDRVDYSKLDVEFKQI